MLSFLNSQWTMFVIKHVCLWHWHMVLLYKKTNYHQLLPNQINKYTIYSFNWPVQCTSVLYIGICCHLWTQSLVTLWHLLWILSHPVYLFHDFPIILTTLIKQAVRCVRKHRNHQSINRTHTTKVCFMLFANIVHFYCKCPQNKQVIPNYQYQLQIHKSISCT